MHIKKHQHKKRELPDYVYGGVRVPGLPAWALWMGAYTNMGGGYMTGATPGATESGEGDGAAATAGDGGATSSGLGGAGGM